MRIERIDENTVKCYISGEEMDEFNIDYKDFLTRSDRAREVVQEIMQQAEEEVGYKPPKFAFDLQIMMLPDRGLILTFSEKEPELNDHDQLISCLNEMKKVLQKTKDKLNNPGTQASGQNTAPLEDVAAPKGAKPAPVPRPEFAVFIFSTLGKVMEYAAALPVNLRVESSLYKMDGYYFLYFLKGHASQERYSRACIQALEFAGLYAAEESSCARLREHGECLIAEKAIKKLRGLS